jgi:hypothetical protein
MATESRDAPSHPAHKVLYDLKVAKATGAEFQAFFERVMEKHDASFCRIKPGGPEGDWKSDGYATADGTLYQCYAPETIRAGPTTRKIAEDFEGAQAYWKDRLKSWVFVVNRDALPAEVVAVLSDLKNAHSGSTSIHWLTPERLWTEILARFSEAALDDVLGRPPPAENTIRELVKQGWKALRTSDEDKARSVCRDVLDRTRGLAEFRHDRADAYQMLANLALRDKRPEEARRQLDLGEAELDDNSPASFRVNAQRLRAASFTDEEKHDAAEALYRAIFEAPAPDSQGSDEAETVEVLQCFARADYVLSRARRNLTEGLEPELEELERFARQHPSAQDGHMLLHACDALVSGHARRGDEQAAFRALDLIRSYCATKESAFEGATLLQRLTGRLGHLRATSIALACAQLSAELARVADRDDFFWAAQANLVAVYLNSGQLDEARRQLKLLDPVLRNDQADPQLKAGILSLAAMVLAESGAHEQGDWHCGKGAGANARGPRSGRPRRA